MPDDREDRTHEGRPDEQEDREQERGAAADEGKRDLGSADRGVERSDWNYSAPRKDDDIPGNIPNERRAAEPDDSEDVE